MLIGLALSTLPHPSVPAVEVYACALLPEKVLVMVKDPALAIAGAKTSSVKAADVVQKVSLLILTFSHRSSSQVELLKFLAKLAYLALANLKVRNSRANI